VNKASIKPASHSTSKRASLPRVADYTKLFLKDWMRLSHAGRYDMKRCKEAMVLLIANDAPLGAEKINLTVNGSSVQCHNNRNASL
jgi:mRNA interferase YafQ